eukprot:TRINITY_DN7949_c0_g1_i2.p1 TRINITY_DN7949_c0_g1~~TRINITY_DN7949_c0_g1_i2.p1  ORF type:complete len:517 (-),score=137.86 TRINITY_DN7949_c0_g1_i2:131-1660(-)
MEDVEKKLSKDKVDKYDRQLRLWGAHGQAALENAHICLLNATATGTEILKNLVLPGIGRFTIIDGAKVSEEDLGNNFFVSQPDIGRSRAEVTSELLREMNEWVQGTHIAQDPNELIANQLSSFSQYTLVIATNLPTSSLLPLSEFLYSNHIPLVVSRAYGFVGYLRNVVPEHCIFETKPDNPLDDLRLTNPFPSLATYCGTWDLRQKSEGGNLDSHLHSHIPYIVILYQSLIEYRKNNPTFNPTPKTEAEKAEFIKIVTRHSTGEDKNFEEATDAARTHIYPGYRLPDDLTDVLNDDKASASSTPTSNYWIIAQAMKQYVDEEGKTVPVKGSVPDMTADTNSYVSLTEIYYQKSRQDIAKVLGYVRKYEKQANRAEGSVTDEEVERACKSVRDWKVVRYRSIKEEYETPDKDSLEMSVDVGENGPWYVALRAVDRFYEKEKRYPGDVEENVEGDLAKMVEIGKALEEELLRVDEESGEQKRVPDLEKVLREMIRVGGVELHNIGAHCAL